MKAFFSRKIVIAGLITAVVIVGGLLIYKSRSSAPLQFATVKRADLHEEVSVTGQVKAKTSVSLSFQKNGVVAYVNHDVGETVTAGTVLATLENGDARADLLQGEANLKGDEASLAALVRGSRPEEIALEKVKIANDTQALADAKLNLIASIDGSLTTVEDAIQNKVDQFFSNPHGSTPTLNFTIADSQLKTTIESGRFDMERLLSDWHKAMPTFLTGTSDMEAMIQYGSDSLIKVKDFLRNVSLAVNTLTTSSNFTQTTIDGWKSAVSSGRSNVDSSVSGVASYAQAWRNAKSTLALENEQWAIMNAGSDPQDIAGAQAKVLAAQASVDKLSVELDKTQLVSPIDGVVTLQNSKIGQVVTANVPLASVIGEGAYEVEASVPETDIGKVHIGGAVSITLDAYAGDIFLGAVSKIDPAETVVDGVVTYKVTIAFLKDDDKIKSGLTANLEIESQKKIGVLSVPQVVVLETDAGAFVKKKEGSSVVQIPVTLGIRDKNGMVEIVNGLNEGDAVEIIGLK